MKTQVTYLNITRITDYRKDGHPSIYRKQNLSDEERRSPLRFQDCSHWCLPGVPDAWNELLYAEILIRQKQQQQQQQQKLQQLQKRPQVKNNTDQESTSIKLLNWIEFVDISAYYNLSFFLGLQRKKETTWRKSEKECFSLGTNRTGREVKKKKGREMKWG